MAADICPRSRKRCNTAEVCRMMWCAKGRMGQLKPISEQRLTIAERYDLQMAQQRAAPDPEPGR
jgi:hypothetical protein